MSIDALLSDDRGNYRLTEPYRRWMVAQDAVDLGAAAILTTAAHARELGVPEDRLVYLHASADADEPPLSKRADIARSPALARAAGAALGHAGVAAGEIGPIDIYSCFPCAVSGAVEAIGLEGRAQSDLTLTGTLAFFGGPGNGYSLHAIAAMAEALRRDGTKPGLITANGGVLSKQSVGIWSAAPPPGGYRPFDSADILRDPATETGDPLQPAEGLATVESYTIAFTRGAAGAASLVTRTESGHRALALLATPPAERDLLGARVRLSPGDKRNHAELL